MTSCFARGQLISDVQELFLQQQESVALPDEALDLVGLPAAEHEEDILLERVNAQLTGDNSGQTLNSLTEVGIAALS